MLERIISIGVENLSLSNREETRVPGGEEKIEGEENSASRHFLERITALAISEHSTRMRSHLTGSSPYLWIFYADNSPVQLFLLLREKRFRIRGTYRGKVPYNSALYIDCRSQSLYVLLSKQTYVRNKFPTLLVSNCKTIQFLASLFLRVTIFLLRKSQNSQTFLLIDRIIRILIYKYINIYITRPINIFEFILARYRA